MLDRPVPDRQPEGGGDGRRGARGRDPAHPRARRPPRRHGRHRQAHGREGAGDRRARGRDRGRRRRGRRRPQLRRHGHVRLGLGEDRARLAHRGLAEGHRAHARRAADPLRRPPDLPPRRHRAVQRPAADRRPRRPASSSRWCRSAATTRWTATTRSPPSSSSTRPRSIPIHYGTFPLVETDAQAFKQDVQQAGFSRCSCSTPATRTRCDDPRRRPDRGRARRAADARRRSSPTSTGVAEAYCVTGEWDFVAILRVRNPEEVAQVVTHRLRARSRASAHADDGRVRGLLPARPRGAVQHRQLTPRHRRARTSARRSARSSPACPRSRAIGGDRLLVVLALARRRAARAAASTADGMRIVARAADRVQPALPPGMKQLEPKAGEWLHLRAQGPGPSHRRAAAAARLQGRRRRRRCRSSGLPRAGRAQAALPRARAGRGGQGAHQPASPGYSLVVPREPQAAHVRPARAAARSRSPGARRRREAAAAGHARRRRGQGARRRHPRRAEDARTAASASGRRAP